MYTLDKIVKKHVFSRNRNHEMAAILLKKINSEGYSRIVELQNRRVFHSKIQYFERKTWARLGSFINPRVNEFVHS